VFYSLFAICIHGCYCSSMLIDKVWSFSFYSLHMFFIFLIKLVAHHVFCIFFWFEKAKENRYHCTSIRCSKNNTKESKNLGQTYRSKILLLFNKKHVTMKFHMYSILYVKWHKLITQKDPQNGENFTMDPNMQYLLLKLEERHEQKISLGSNHV